MKDLLIALNSLKDKKNRIEKLKKVSLKSKNVNLSISDDLINAVDSYSNSLETADKVLDIAIKVNNIVSNITEDVRYYNEYYANTYEDLGRAVGFLEDTMSKASEMANELGFTEEQIDGYKEASNLLIDIKSVSGNLISNPLILDI